MPIVPSERWFLPATVWDEIVERYIQYIQVPTWRAKAWNPDGTPTTTCKSERAARALGDRIHGAIDPLVEENALTSGPHGAEGEAIEKLRRVLEQREHRADFPKDILPQIWRALMFNRDGYTCRYCARTAWGVFEESNRTIRLELDHLVPRAKAPNPDDYDVSNIVTACRACNDLKGQMPEQQFLAELESLARGVLRKAGEGR